MLADLLQKRERWIVAYHEHDSLLENKIDEELSEEDRKAAWEEYEDEKKGIRQVATNSYESRCSWSDMWMGCVPCRRVGVVQTY